MHEPTLSPDSYVDLEIRIFGREQRGYPVELTCAGQEAPRRFLRPGIERWTSKADPLKDGERLFNLLFADHKLKEEWASLRARHPHSRIRLRIDGEAAQLDAWPWELLREPGSQVSQILAADVDTPFSRYLPGNGQSQPIAERPIKVLVALANPQDLARYNLSAIEVEQEQASVQTALTTADPHQVAITFLPPPVSLKALEDELRKQYHVLHIVAHGTYRRQRDHPVLLLANEHDQVVDIDDTTFAEVFSRLQTQPQVIVLASCHSGERSTSDSKRGFAAKLLAAGVPAVVVMQDQILVDATREFTGTLYKRLLQHGQIDLATNEARSTLISAHFEDSWGIPVLYSRIPNGTILAPQPQATKLDEIRRQPTVARMLKLLSRIFAVLSVIGLLLALILDIAELRSRLFPRITPMPERGFNIAVAPFTAHDPADQGAVVAAQEMNKWLFDAVDAEAKQQQNIHAPNVRGPQEIQQIAGADRAARALEAAKIAEQHHATMVIYGVITANGQDYQVEPEFYISNTAFQYGQEIAGPERLGTPITFTLPLNQNNTPLAVNRKLYARTEALRSIVDGLASFHDGAAEKAWAEFQDAALVKDWADEEGKEVVYLLMGAAKLKADNLEAPCEKRKQTLAEAQEAFEHGYAINNRYARSYLGLGAVALQQAQLSTCSSEVQATKLLEAYSWYKQGSQLSDQSPAAYLEEKARYGLGHVHLMGLVHGLNGWSEQEAQQHFASVIDSYAAYNRPPDLIEIAAASHAGQGALAFRAKQWSKMAAEYLAATQILRDAPGNSLNKHKWLAYYWGGVGDAEAAQQHVAEAINAYKHAIEIGTGAVNAENIQNWQAKLDHLR